MSDENERSVASAGSVADKPAAYRVYVRGIGSIMPLCRDWVEVQGMLNRFGDRVFGVAPLYEEQPTLTETERLAIEWATVAARDQSQVAVHKTLRRLLERTE